MNSSTITVHWHDGNLPVYSLAFQPGSSTVAGSSSSNSAKLLGRLATAGGDNNVRIWQLVRAGDSFQVEYLSTLRKHSQAVNVVRFNSDGTRLASAGDDGTVIVWALAPQLVREFGDEDDENKESWSAETVLRSGVSEIYDICWSPQGDRIATGSMDHVVRVFDVKLSRIVDQIDAHSHYVQGIAWDPQNVYLTSQSADRCVNVHKAPGSASPLSLLHKLMRLELPVSIGSTEFKSSMLYHPETLQSFFRRLSFSPDGSLLLTPLGVSKDENGEEINTVFVYVRACLTKPVAQLPRMKKPAIAVSFCPILYKANADPVVKLPYVMRFAVATQDSVIIYDTAALKPLGMVSNLHYSTITDLAWHPNGQILMASSADGFCSVIELTEPAEPHGPSLPNLHNLHNLHNL